MLFLLLGGGDAIVNKTKKSLLLWSLHFGGEMKTTNVSTDSYVR